MKQDSPVVTAKDCPGLFWCWGIRGAAISLTIFGTAELAFQAHPWSCYNAARVDWFSVCCLSRYSSSTIFFQIHQFHVYPVTKRFLVSVHRSGFRVGFLSLALLVGQPEVWRDETTTGGAGALSMIIHVLKVILIQHQLKLSPNFGARPFRTHETTVHTCPTYGRRGFSEP